MLFVLREKKTPIQTAALMQSFVSMRGTYLPFFTADDGAQKVRGTLLDKRVEEEKMLTSKLSTSYGRK